MAAQTGRTNAKHIGFFLDNSSGTLTDLTAYTKSVGTVGLAYETQDVTAFSDGTKNVTIGQPTADLQVEFQFDTTVITHLSAINPATPLSLDIRFGIRQAWQSGEPQFGISMSTTSGYVLTGFTASNVDGVTATFKVYGPTAPAWGTAAET